VGLLRALDGDGGTDMNLSSGAGCRVAHIMYVYMCVWMDIYIYIYIQAQSKVEQEESLSC
jgi:hypothetical protein